MLILAGCEPDLLVRGENAGPVERSDLVVTVTGERYALPPIPPGGTTEVAVEPRGESAVAVESGGRTLGACCYIEPAYRGYAHFRIDGDSAAVCPPASG